MGHKLPRGDTRTAAGSQARSAQVGMLQKRVVADGLGVGHHWPASLARVPRRSSAKAALTILAVGALKASCADTGP